MKEVNVRDVRNKFSQVIKNNEEIIVLRRNTPVALIKPISKKELLEYYIQKAQNAVKGQISEDEVIKIVREIRQSARDNN
ncbi:type II toxin-antitoxin system Phd/YefM family antitoxin [Athalassotoga saccharophila]|uniref:Uncharacterized protein n=1 Tax=Athalassotoga saccharophila TaxID=1441386 RepID=A0A6N4TDM2_9BACT|nr:type II toxin-antitoxin system Phd/YefM family antitoxin [Athalassotoga saccharophila]BBJ29088.1 hypothetical protein ATHSA_p10041 [Athalassotoga saccharophila]